MFGLFYFDWTLLVVIPGLLFTLWAQYKVKSSYARYAQELLPGYMTGAAVARRMLDSNGLSHIPVEIVRGHLSDHYDPRHKVLRLSEGVYASRSISAIGVAAHECGHAIQHQVDYAPLKLRSAAVPVANFGSWLSWPVILLGLILGYPSVAQFGVLLFTFVVAFQLITLPVEFNASSRAMAVLESEGLLSGDDLSGAGKVLRAAAMTYVAALFSAILQLLRLVLIAGRSRSRD